MIGLINAADNWDESKSKFSTFACKCIGNEIKNEFRKRSKHYGVLSLDYEVDTEEGIMAFGDIIVGDEDVHYVDFGIDVEKLRPREKQVFELLQGNMTYADIARELDVSRQAIWTIARKLRKMRG
jgi:RNA polymerase sigma factor (sigma-70 family)